MSELLNLSVPITAFSFNGDGTQLALCPNTNEVHIYSNKGGKWSLDQVLTEHDKLVSSIDWAPHTNRLLTCSHDRNAYVWTFEPASNKWEPTLVLLRVNRSATFARWAPDEQKFAVASSARTIAVCTFDQESNWWVAKHIKKPLRSTVLSIAWHPNSVLLASGSTDGVARVFSAFIKGVDQKPEPTVWGERLPFNTVCGEFPSIAYGWVHDVAFSPSGNVLAFVAHDATVTIVYPSGPEAPPAALYHVNLQGLPMMSLSFVTDDKIVAGGHDSRLLLFSGNESGWDQGVALDDSAASKANTSGALGRSTGRLNNEAFNLFRAADSRGVSGGASASSGPAGSSGPLTPSATGSSSSSQSGMLPGTKMTTSGTELLGVHQNTIVSVRTDARDPSRVHTAGSDGKIVEWNALSGVAGVTAGMKRMGV